MPAETSLMHFDCRDQISGCAWRGVEQALRVAARQQRRDRRTSTTATRPGVRVARGDISVVRGGAGAAGAARALRAAAHQRA